jgi:predicted transcriptional regulator
VEHAPVNVTDAEWAILELLWEQGPRTVRQLTDVLYPRGGPSEYATVHKLLERLHAKGAVRRGKRDGTILILATVARDALVGRQLEALVDKMCGGSLQPLLTNLVKAKGITPEELEELLALVNQLKANAKSKKR